MHYTYNGTVYGTVTCTETPWGHAPNQHFPYPGVDVIWHVECVDQQENGFSKQVRVVPGPNPPPPPPPPGVQIVSNTSSLVTFRNNDGDWTIWKGCFSNGGATIGPGYIGRVITPQGVTILNDEDGPPGGVNSFRGGLGAFGVHYARGVPPFALDSWPFPYVADMTGRDCSAGGSQGVYQVDITQAPVVSGGVGYFDLIVWIRDPWGNTGYGPDDPADGDTIGDGGLKLTYLIRVHDSVVKHWATVTTYLQWNSEGFPFAKEPKFTGSLPNTNAGHKRIAVFGGANGLTMLRAYTGNLPQGSRHSYDDNRLRVRYDFGTRLKDESGNWDETGHCNGTIQPCLNVLFRATPPGGGWTFWEQPAGSNWGLDRWATDAADELRINNDDQPNPCTPPNCPHGPPYSWNCNATGSKGPPFNNPEESTAHQDVRGWEFGGTSSGDFQPYTNLMTLATGWEGGRGSRDCESISMQFPWLGSPYSVEMDYSIDSGW